MVWMWLAMACDTEPVDDGGCDTSDTIAVASYETDEDGQIWLDGRDSTYCSGTKFSWWEVTDHIETGGDSPPTSTDLLMDSSANISENATYVALNMDAWAGQELTIHLALCNPGNVHLNCFDFDLSSDEITVSVP